MQPDSMRAELVLPVPNFLIATVTEGPAQSASVFPAGQACWRRSVEDRIITQVVQSRPRPHYRPHIEHSIHQPLAPEEEETEEEKEGWTECDAERGRDRITRQTCEGLEVYSPLGDV